MMKGDKQVVNVISGHPSICVMATSGIENNVKLWEPIANPADLQTAPTVAEDNQQRALRSIHPFAWFLPGGSDDSGEEEDFECEVQ